jgi:shikimate kinase
MVITFIGMPGSGKSCMGRAMAGKLKMKLIDSDKLIEKRCGKKLQELIDELGIEEFRRIEEETLLSITGDNLIVSTGGSAVYSDAGMRHLKELGKVFYLFCSYETVKKRIGDFSKRGIVLKPGQTILDLYNERAPLYKKYADVTILCDGEAYPQYQSAVIRAAKRYRAKDKERQSDTKEGL